MEIHFTQILFQIVNVSVVIGALSYLLYKPVLQVLEERSKKIEEAQQHAAVALQEKAELEKMKAEAKRQAEKEAAKVLEEARKAADTQREKMLVDAKEEAQQKIEKLKQQWQTERQASIVSMQKEFSEAVFTVAEKVVAESLDKKAHEKLIKEELNTLLGSL